MKTKLFNKINKKVKYDSLTGIIKDRDSGCIINDRMITIDGKKYHTKNIAWILVFSDMPKIELKYVKGNSNKISNLEGLNN